MYKVAPFSLLTSVRPFYKNCTLVLLCEKTSRLLEDFMRQLFLHHGSVRSIMLSSSSQAPGGRGKKERKKKKMKKIDVK